MTELVSRVKKMRTHALEKSTSVKQVDNHVIKINTTRLERHPLVRKFKKRIIIFFQMKRDVRDIRCFLSDLSSIDRARTEFSPFQRLVNFIYNARFQNIFILLRFEKVFI